MDSNQLLRVGGHLQQFALNRAAKHPLIIPNKHRFTDLLFLQEQLRLHHAPPQMLLAAAREQFWPLKGPSIAKITVQKCFVCMRSHPKLVQLQMVPSPASQATQAKMLTTVGVGYTCPF